MFFKKEEKNSYSKIHSKKNSLNFEKKDLRRKINNENFDFGGLGPNLDENWKKKFIKK